MEYNFKVKHIKGSSNCTADSLSRLPVSTEAGTASYPDGQLHMLGELPTMYGYEILNKKNSWKVFVSWQRDHSRIMQMLPLHGWWVSHAEA